MRSGFLPEDGCLVGLDDSKCGDKIPDVAYTPPYYTCGVCFKVIHTESDIEGDTDSDFQPGPKDGTDGEGEDDEAGDSDGNVPVDGTEVKDTPEEAMRRNTEVQLREIIEELQEGEINNNWYTNYFIENFVDLVSFYMLFTKYGPYKVIDRPSEKKEVIIEIACAYIMMDKGRVRFLTLAKATGYSEPGIIRAALRFIRTHKGDDYLEGGYLIEIYTPAVGLPSNFIEPMKTAWQNIRHPTGQIRDKVVAFIGAYAKHSEVKITDSELSKRTGASRTTISQKRKQYYEILDEYLNQR